MGKKILKKTLPILLLAMMLQTIGTLSFSQSPEKMAYQVLIFGENNQPVVNKKVSIRISIIQAIATGYSVYEEILNPITNSDGLASFEIGSGICLAGSFSGINWSNGPYFLKTEIDYAGGNNYTIMGTSQLLSVPYALFAKTAGNTFSGKFNDLTEKPTGTHTGDILYWKNNEWKALPVGLPGQFLRISKFNMPEWEFLTKIDIENAEELPPVEDTVTGCLAPTLSSTTEVFAITTTTASSGGVITDPGASPYTITSRGVCWSTSANPTISLSTKTSDGTGTGSFTSYLTNLSPSTLYYVRAYATNSGGFISYGSEVSFTTANTSTPTVITYEAYSITANSATIEGQTDDAGLGTIARGVYCSTQHNPTVTDLLTSDISGSTQSRFHCYIQNLSPSTVYYSRAFAVFSNLSIVYGNEVSFTTQDATIPSITTNAVTSISGRQATCGGNITSSGGSIVTSRGVCWSLNQNPTIVDNVTNNGSGIGAFTSNITNLNPPNVYYVRAYATNSVGTAYGEQVSFTSILALPVISVESPVSNLTSSSATCVGHVNDDGGSAVTARGFCWSSATTPTISDNHTTNGSGTGSFTNNITGLSINNTYHVRAYATNSVGTAYSGELVFSTGVGASHLGGTIAYILQNGDPGYSAQTTHGLIISSIRSSMTLPWSVSQHSILTSSNFGQGNSNTNTIVNRLGTESNAAYECYVSIEGGYSDWYLPSIDELKKIYINKQILSLGEYNQVWSSSSNSIGFAYCLDFATGIQSEQDQTLSFNFFPVMSF